MLMNSFTHLFETISTFGSQLITTFMMYALTGSVAAFLAFFFIIKRLSRKGYFDRPNLLWSFIAKLNRIYMPFILMLMIGFLSGVYGVNSKVNTTIEQGVHTAIDALSLQHISTQNLASHINGQRSMEQILALELGKNNTNHHQNSIIAKTILSEFGYPSQIDDLVHKIQNIDLSAFQNGLHFGVSYYATDYIDGIFWIAYRFIIMFFLFGMLKLSIIEIGIYAIYRKLFGSHSPKPQEISVQDGSFVMS